MCRNKIRIRSVAVLASAMLVVNYGCTQEATPLQGAWLLTSRENPALVGVLPAVNSEPQPELWLFTKTHYSIMSVRGDEPRGQYSGGITDTERVEAYRTIGANSGSYEMSGNELTFRAYLANDPNYMGEWPYNARRIAFEVEGDQLQLTFENGGKATFRQVDGEAPPVRAPRTGITVAPEILSEYLGTYMSGDDGDEEFLITLAGDSLMGWPLPAGVPLQAFELRQGPERPLIPTSETRFYLGASGTELEFVRDAQGIVTHFILYQLDREEEFVHLEDPSWVGREVMAHLNHMRRTQYIGTLNSAQSEGEFLSELIVELDAQRVLEIGTSNGYSAIWLALGLQETGGELITLEIDEGRHALAQENFAATGVDDIIDARLGDALQEIPKLAGPFDLVFIDGWNDDYPTYLDLVLPKVRAGGVIAASDMDSRAWPGIRAYQERIESSPALETRYRLNGLAISYKR